MRIWTDVPDTNDCRMCLHLLQDINGSMCRLFNVGLNPKIPCEMCLLRRDQAARELVKYLDEKK